MIGVIFTVGLGCNCNSAKNIILLIQKKSGARTSCKHFKYLNWRLKSTVNFPEPSNVQTNCLIKTWGHEVPRSMSLKWARMHCKQSNKAAWLQPTLYDSIEGDPETLQRLKAHSQCIKLTLSITTIIAFLPRDALYVDQGHTGWKSWKLIARTISPTPSLFVA